MSRAAISELLISDVLPTGRDTWETAEHSYTWEGSEGLRDIPKDLRIMVTAHSLYARATNPFAGTCIVRSVVRVAMYREQAKHTSARQPSANTPSVIQA